MPHYGVLISIRHFLLFPSCLFSPSRLPASLFEREKRKPPFQDLGVSLRFPVSFDSDPVRLELALVDFVGFDMAFTVL